MDIRDILNFLKDYDGEEMTIMEVCGTHTASIAENAIPSLISGHFTDNPASGRVMEKCGFIPTGETTFDSRLYMGADKPIRVLRLEL